MANELSLASALKAQLKEAVLSRMLALADAIGLATETWAKGDPTRSLFDVVSRMIEADDPVIVDEIKSGFIGLASGLGLTRAAKYLRNVDRIPAQAGTCTFEFTNSKGATYDWEPDELTFWNPATEATYRNKTAIHLAGNSTATCTIEAEVAGTGSNAGIGEIELVVAVPNVSGSNTTVCVGVDEEQDPALQNRSDAKLGSLSPAGASLGFEYVALTPEFNGGVSVTRTRVIAESDINAVTVYLADDAGAVSNDVRDAVEEGEEQWANPANCDLTVIAATNQSIAITYELWVYDSIASTEAEVEALVEDALTTAFADKAIGGDVIPPATSGKVYVGWIEAIILQAVSQHGFRVAVTVPAADVSITTIGHVPTLGAITPTINLVATP